ncbi:MAG: carbohydrate binding domain-containing protein, partial [Armatimonadetes bacterium]|nr:carbohydrate binding domain-containing protein [Armatimonadota bacterium]
MLMSALVVLALPWSADGQAPAAKNLAPNPSFETGAKGAAADWRFWGWAPEGMARTAAGEWDQTVARTGAASLKITNGGPKDVGTWCNRQGQGFIPVTPGKVYTVSIHMKVESVDAAVSTNFRLGFCTIGADGKVTYFPAETRR